MADNVYHRFTVNDTFETKVYTTPSVIVESGSTGWSSNLGGPSGSLTLYGGVRGRSDIFSGSFSTHTNYVPWSNAEDGAGVVAYFASVVANSASGPNTGLADAIVENSGILAPHQTRRTFTLPVGQYTFSTYVRSLVYPGDRDFTFGLVGSSGTMLVEWSLSSGSLLTGGGDVNIGYTTSSIVPVGANFPGWQLCTTLFSTTVPDTYTLQLGIASFTGTGYFGNGTSGILIDGVQIENGATRTPFIITTAGSASRNDQPIQIYPLDEVDTHSIDKVIQVPGQYPATGALNLAYCTNTEPNYVSDITDTRWYEEHYAPIAGLFDWYHDHVRFTYTPSELLPQALWVVHVPAMVYGRQIATGSVLITDTTTNTGSTTYVDDGYGNLIISGTYTGQTTTQTIINLSPNSENLSGWSVPNVSRTLNAIQAPDGNNTGDKITEVATGSAGPHGVFQNLTTTSGTQYTFSIYAKAAEVTKVYIVSSGPAFSSSNGVAWWDLSASTSGIESNADSIGMSDAGNGWYRIWMTDTTPLSGVSNFFVELTNESGTRLYTSSSVPGRGIYLWGGQLNPGALQPYLPTGATTASITYTNAGQVGNVFYNEGLIVFTNNPYYPPGQGPYHRNGDPRLHIQFSGSHIINSKVFMCRLHENECNCSRNPTWSQNVSGTLVRKGADNTTYITSIGIYNEDYELVAVAKLAQPIRKREKDRIDIRLRMDF